jgi:hypothetical protein
MEKVAFYQTHSYKQITVFPGKRSVLDLFNIHIDFK